MRDDLTPNFLGIERVIRAMSESEIIRQYESICKIIEMHEINEKRAKEEKKSKSDNDKSDK